MEEVLEQPELIVPAHERSLERLAAVAPADLGHDPQGAPGGDRGRLALECLLAGLFEGDRPRCRPLGRLANEDGPRLGGRLEAGRRVDEVAGDQSLVRRADRDRRFTGQDPCPGLDRGSECLDRIDELEAGSNGPLGVVLVGGRRAPHGHDGIADELLDRPSVPADDIGRDLEVVRQGLTDVLGVPLFRERGEPDQVGEQDRDEPALRCRARHGGGLPGPGRRVRHRGDIGQLGRAFAAELGGRRVQRPAVGAARGQARCALDAELAPGFVVGAAVRADHVGATPARR